jgi:hypothetical protein
VGNRQGGIEAAKFAREPPCEWPDGVEELVGVLIE